MQLITDHIEKLLTELNHTYIENFPDKQLNCLYNYWHFLQEQEEEIISAKDVSLEVVLYSKYYWFSRLTDRFHEVYGTDAGIDQQQFMIMEELDQRLEQVDWELVEGLQNGDL
ncbi:MAG: hypothetical protein IJ379_03030 [Lachnospiraceae bacterium]|nr:hypothetical protein [Lachnospiraceae bacterium]